MEINKKILFIIFIQLLTNSCLLQMFSQENQQGKTFLQDTYNDQNIKIDQLYNLQNKTVTFNNCTLEISDKGIISNGKLKGKGNTIKTESSSIFNSIIFESNFLIDNFHLSWWYIPDTINKSKNNTKIQEVLNSIPDSSKLIFDKSYQILCDPVYIIRNKNGLYIDFNNSHFFTNLSGGQSSSFFLIDTSNNITFNNISILGDTKFHAVGDPGQWGRGISIRGSNNILIENSIINQCWGDNIYITGGNNDVPSSNIVIKNCNLIDGRRNSISIINAHDINIQSCRLLKTTILPEGLRAVAPFAGIDLEPNTENEKVTNVTIENCQFNLGNVGTIGFLNTNNPQGNSIQISNCEFSEMKHAFVLLKSENITIDSCTFNNISSSPILLRNITDIQITNNKFTSLQDPTKSVEGNFSISKIENYTFKNNILVNL